MTSTVAPLSYTVVLHDIPFGLPLNVLAESLVPEGGDEPACQDKLQMSNKSFSASSCQNTSEIGGTVSNRCEKSMNDDIIVYLKEKCHIKVVPYALQVFKEALSKKFGLVTFIAVPLVKATLSDFTALSSATEERRREVHEKIVDWIKNVLPLKLSVIQCKCTLAQPKDCFQGVNFLQALGLQCEILRKSEGQVPSKLTAFFLSKVQFLDNTASSPSPPHPLQLHRSEPFVDSPDRTFSSSLSSAEHDPLNHDTSTTLRKAEKESEWKVPCGLLSLTASTFTPMEVVWLKKVLGNDAPPIQMINSDIKTSHFEPRGWRLYLTTGLQPLIQVV